MSNTYWESLTPDQQQELAAGYVLGDLDSEELILLQERLVQDPKLMAFVEQLQETLGAIPYGLVVQQPGQNVRSQILTAAAPTSVPQRRQRRPWLWGLGGVGVGMAIMWGIPQRQWVVEEPPNPAAGEVEVLQASAQFVTGNWQDLDEVVADHLRSVTQASGPVDFETDAIADIRKRYADRIELPKTLPQIEVAQLLGGSFCELKHTLGLRYTYKTPASSQLVSFYQLVPANNIAVPQLTQERLYLKIAAGPTIALWQDQSYIYVLAANLTVSEMQKLMIRPTVAQPVQHQRRLTVLAAHPAP